MQKNLNTLERSSPMRFLLIIGIIAQIISCVSTQKTQEFPESKPLHVPYIPPSQRYKKSPPQLPEKEEKKQLPISVSISSVKKVEPNKLFIVAPIKNMDAETLYLMYSLYNKLQIRQVEKLRLVPITISTEKIDIKADKSSKGLKTNKPLEVSPQYYQVTSDALTKIQSKEEVLIWDQPAYYVFIDLYNSSSDKTSYVFIRMVDIYSGIIDYQFYIEVKDPSSPEEALLSAMPIFTNYLNNIPSTKKKFIIGDVIFDNSTFSIGKEIVLSVLLKNPDIIILEREFAPLNNSGISAPQELGEVKFFKLYDKQFSLISKSCENIWTDADYALFVEFSKPWSYYPDLNLKNNENQLKSLSAKLVNQKNGEIEAFIHIISQTEVSNFEMIDKLVETLSIQK